MRTTLAAFAVLIAAGLVFFLLPAGQALSQQAQEGLAQQLQQVLVANFPELQKIDGTVAVTRPVPHSAMVRQLGVVVPPVGRHDTTDLIEGSEIPTAGFTGVTLSLQGYVKGTLGQAGNVGVLLIPVEDAIQEAFDQDGQIQLSLEVMSVLARREIETFSAQNLLAVGFPLYKAYFYNSTDKAVEVNLYAYLTN